MKILLNGENRQVAKNVTVAALLTLLQLGQRRLAVEINEDVVPRSQFTEHRLNDGDRVEIVHAIGGG